MAELRTYSVLIAWDDDDDEQGEFGETVRARDSTHAERIVRARMARSHWENYLEPGESRAESLAGYRRYDGQLFGRVLDLHEGAIWKAKDLEKALRDMRAAYTRLHDFMSDAIEGGRLTRGHLPDDYDAIADQLEVCATADAGAEAVLKEIDGM